MQITWIGISGKKYTYELVPLAAPLPESNGNYVFTKNILGTWHAVYVGQGHLPSRYLAALKEGCVQRHGATHYSYHTRHANDEDARKKNPTSSTATQNAKLQPVVTVKVLKFPQ